ncbi:4-alpha-glucanotransferase [Cellulosilyticum ruminicola]|uniref:4-alpha-glucanotransferase n=1 Tax=Cellulosilyticum ruminicola TaxID=425254 RepID=UPI0006D108F9|nr:4-alpha-glucanotransferase [Cellulosilyticum ruminicola]
MNRASGILMHITSLPEAEGIGTFGRQAYNFVDFLKASDQTYWQILPIGPTGYGNSPYQAFSAFAGNPYLIDLKTLVNEKLLAEETYQTLCKVGTDFKRVEFEEIIPCKMAALKEAYEKAKSNKDVMKNVDEFQIDNQSWLEDYSLFMAIKTSKNEVSWQEWEEPLKQRESKVIQHYKEVLKDEIQYWTFLQYMFYKQWMALKEYANAQGIKIIGDIPIYVAGDSSDTWSHPEFFKLDEKGTPLTVAGCPPDAFTEDGQLWGNPIYDWDTLKKQDYAWWIERIKQNALLYDVIRIDHFRGFESFWEVPYGDETAKNGQWTKGPSISLFKAIKKKLGRVNIIAEDLGFMTDEVIALREATGYPGMNILQFAFDPKGDSDYLPHNQVQNSVVYTGTHDNDTIVGWTQLKENKKALNFAKRYLRLTTKEGYYWGFIRGVWASPANLAIVPMQDLLGLDNTARMNVPSTIGGINWKWRMEETAINEGLIIKLKKLTKLYGRKGKNNE